jgi:hypothetical protein
VGEARGDVSDAVPADVEQAADRLEAKADAIRGELGELVGELDHRRRELAPRLRLLKPVAIAAGVVIAGTAAARAWRQTRRRGPVAPARRLVRRLARRR